jgi:hypothetical protein
MAEWYLVPVPFWLILLLSTLQSVPRGSGGPRQEHWCDPSVALLIAGSPATIGRSAFRQACRKRFGPGARTSIFAPLASQNRAAVGSVIAPPVNAGMPAIASSSTRWGWYHNLYRLILPDRVLVVYAVPAELVAELHPDYVVSLEVFLRRTLLSDATFRSDYREIWRAETNAFGSQGLLIFERVSSKPPP